MKFEPISWHCKQYPDYTIDRVQSKDGEYVFAVRYGRSCFGKDGRFHYEPYPSERSDLFLINCRFASLKEAIAAAKRAILASR